MGKYSGGKAWLAVLIVKKDGKKIEDVPSKGAYSLALKPGQVFGGRRETVVAELQAEFKGCTFAWE